MPINRERKLLPGTRVDLSAFVACNARAEFADCNAGNLQKLPNSCR